MNLNLILTKKYLYLFILFSLFSLFHLFTKKFLNLRLYVNKSGHLHYKPVAKLLHEKLTYMNMLWINNDVVQNLCHIKIS